MNASSIWIAVSVAALVIAAVLVFLVGRGRQKNKLTPLAGLGFAFIVAGIVFGEERLVGYSLMGIGVILAVVDIFTRSKSE